MEWQHNVSTCTRAIFDQKSPCTNVWSLSMHGVVVKGSSYARKYETLYPFYGIITEYNSELL